MNKVAESIWNSPQGILARREYWRHRGKREFESVGDYDYIRRRYAKLGRRLDLANPRRYTEKLQWLKLFYRDPLIPVASDKYEVRAYLESLGHGRLLNELIAVYDDADDVDVGVLPESFVLKAAHGSGWNLIAKDKSEVDWFWWKRIMRSWMKQDLEWFGREWNYGFQKPRIIVEKYLEDDSGELRDYKVVCMNGKPMFMQIDESRSTDHKRMYIDCEGNALSMGDSQNHNRKPRVEIGGMQRRMFDLAKELSRPFPNVRVDFYDCNGRIYFGEFTFFGGSGFYSFEPDEWDYTWGEHLQLPEPNWNLGLLETVRSR